ncbi:MAG: hypothetical protein ACXU7H_06095 [Burkholderiaceae bacterium]
MKNLFSTLLLTLALAGCSERPIEERFIGSWTQTNSSTTQLSATISKVDDGYLVEIKLPIPNQPPGVVRRTGKFQGDVLVADGMEKIRLVPDTGHLMIGVNEFEAVK